MKLLSPVPSEKFPNNPSKSQITVYIPRTVVHTSGNTETMLESDENINTNTSSERNGATGASLSNEQVVPNGSLALACIC